MSQKRCYIYGLHAVSNMLSSTPDKICQVWVQQSHNPKIQSLCHDLVKWGVTPQKVSHVTLDNMSNHGVHQGVVAEVIALHNLESLSHFLNVSHTANSVYLILDSIQDPHNIGACIRTAAAADVTAVIISKNRTAPISATVHKVASGAVGQIPIIQVANIARAIRQLQKVGIWVVGTDLQNSTSVFAQDFRVPLGVVMGNEASGLRPYITSLCDDLIKIPLKVGIDSLNVSVAAGIILYEIKRQQSISS